MSIEMMQHSLFFAARPYEPESERVNRLAQVLAGEHQLRGNPIPPERLHVSLNMVGKAPGAPPEGVVDLAKRIGDEVALRPFKVTFNHVQSWSRSNGPLVLVGEDNSVIGLRLLHDALSEAGGLEPDPHFAPHISLIWSPDFVPERVVEPISWTVREFVLIQSVRGQGLHQILGRWLLKGDEG